MKIAVLAVQGAFIEHEKKLETLGAECFELRQKKDLNTGFDGLVPGWRKHGPGKLLRELVMFDALKEKNRERHAGPRYLCRLILLADQLTNDGHVYFGTLPVSVRRNAYGRQSKFHTVQEFAEPGRFL